MKWWNLLKNKCPRCSQPIFRRSTGFYSCNTEHCDFKIVEFKFEQLCAKMTEENLSRNAPEFSTAGGEKDYNEP